MKRMIRNATTWLMIFCMIVGFVTASGSVAAAQAKPVPSAACAESKPDAVPAEEPSEGTDLEEMQSVSLFEVLLNFLKAIGENLRSISTDDILKLPAGVMDDVVTYIFGAFRLLGINVDWLYEKVLSIFHPQ